MKQSVTIVQDKHGDYTAHAAGCRDIARANDIRWSINATSKREVALDAYSDFIDEGSMTAEEAMIFLRFLPCVKLPLEARNATPVLVAYIVGASEFDIAEFAPGAVSILGASGDYTVVEQGEQEGETVYIDGKPYTLESLQKLTTFRSVTPA